ncbi:MAG TPA: hypothetical protein VF714_11370 [Jatrophihabitans sp.]|jgi:hypothetical protein
MAIGGRGLWAIVAGLVVVLAVPGCAPEPLSAPPARHGIDFAEGEAANGAAAELGMQLLPELAGLPGYAGLRIVSDGIEVSNVGTPTPDMRAAVARHVRRYQGSPVPVRFRSVRYTEQELLAVGSRLANDQQYWKIRGIEYPAYGIDPENNRMHVQLSRYLPQYRDALVARYGDLVWVTPLVDGGGGIRGA